ncbi:phosphatidylinositol mannoside acyltransferase [Demequina lignilytica]|uniref:Phosphatidylinositol mannoside acyltransferase n=1 Tax=Demequina lignilytica TaxID=3051663 RepID=A0AB35MEB7_9MICO|nr:phosphatidylinositol mannoside acyltransferase [Demequina sp. SYSU T0a273]MDN4482085.1 phosphatidylinositol mannoside acyltransferase [Demequina sp. SYSU T0a273]
MNGFLLAFKASRYVPAPVIHGLAWAGTMLQWSRRAKPTVRLEGNLRRVTGLEGDELRRLSRRGMRSTARYYAETFTLGRLSGDVIDARVRMVNAASIHEAMARDGRVVVALSHSGNWDIVGAYACRNIGPVVTVAEVLKPREVFDAFVALRENVGMRILGHEGGSTFRELVRIGRTDGGVLCLLADRDLSGSGLEVDFAGQPAKVAPGPAALAIATRSTLLPLMVHYERLRGRAAWRARSRWGIVMTFGEPLLPADAPKDDAVGHLTRGWVDFVGARIREHPEDWHMLQRFGWTEGA